MAITGNWASWNNGASGESKKNCHVRLAVPIWFILSSQREPAASPDDPYHIMDGSHFSGWLLEPAMSKDYGDEPWSISTQEPVHLGPPPGRD
jgi:hypothetical protein